MFAWNVRNKKETSLDVYSACKMYHKKWWMWAFSSVYVYSSLEFDVTHHVTCLCFVIVSHVHGLIIIMIVIIIIMISLVIQRNKTVHVCMRPFVTLFIDIKTCATKRFGHLRWLFWCGFSLSFFLHTRVSRRLVFRISTDDKQRSVERKEKSHRLRRKTHTRFTRFYLYLHQ